MTRRRILFIDDEWLMREMMPERLVTMGFDVVAVESGEEAIETFRNDPEGFDLVLTDLLMPGMHGDTLSEKIHLIRSSVPVVLITGHPHLITWERVRASGICNMIPKTITTAELSEALRDAL